MSGPHVTFDLDPDPLDVTDLDREWADGFVAGWDAAPRHPHRAAFVAVAVASALVASLLTAAIVRMKEMGLQGIEVYHSDHSPSDVVLFQRLAARLALHVTGGSDYHGTVKARVKLGTGYDGNLNIPRSVLDELRAAV